MRKSALTCASAVGGHSSNNSLERSTVNFLPLSSSFVPTILGV